jgi:SAM-dependent methyltransferase
MKSFRNGSKQIQSLVPSRSRSKYFCTRLIYRFLPAGLRTAIIARFGGDWQFRCPVCENPVHTFSPLPDLYTRELEVHGSDLRMTDFETCNVDAYQCPYCGASDRDRLYALYIGDRWSAVPPAAGFALLDIAPAAALSAHIRHKYTIRYRTADLFQPDVDDRVDITSMDCYANDTFDAFICSHVLEHVPDDRTAMKELLRVLKPGGWGIVMVPIVTAFTDIREDSTKTSMHERWKYFGQGDHVRLYSRAGFVQRLGAAGFKVSTLGCDHFGAEKLARSGLARSSTLYVVEKPAVSADAPAPVNVRGVACKH